MSLCWMLFRIALWIAPFFKVYWLIILIHNLTSFVSLKHCITTFRRCQVWFLIWYCVLLQEAKRNLFLSLFPYGSTLGTNIGKYLCIIAPYAAHFIRYIIRSSMSTRHCGKVWNWTTTVKLTTAQTCSHPYVCPKNRIYSGTLNFPTHPFHTNRTCRYTSDSATRLSVPMLTVWNSLPFFCE